jgi:RHS repeat-associated protein
MTMNRLIQIRLFAIVIAAAACASSLMGAETHGKQLYVVTLDPSTAVAGVQTIASQIAATYGGAVVKEADAPQDAFVIRISAEGARVLARDPRITSVAVSHFRPAPMNATEVVNWAGGVSYSYDGAGNITQIGNDKFLYDDVGRLVRATMNSTQRTYDYDGFGNRKTCSQSGVACPPGFTVNTSENKNRITEAAYDASGNVTGLPSLRHTYTYDAFNMMTRDDFAPMAHEFVYTADDERIGVYDVGNLWRWTVRDATGKVLREFTSGNGPGAVWHWAKDFVWRDGLLLASRQAEPSGTTTYHYHLDHLGTPRRITDDNDLIIGVHDYMAFGPEIPGGTSEPLPAALKYTGHERDTWSEGGLDSLDYMHARYYSPVMGRFLSVDQHASDPGQPQSWNRYIYARNDPINLVDHAGKWASTVFHVHQDAIDTSLAFVAEDRRAILRSAQERVDLDQVNQYKHAMRLPNQSAADAREKAQAFIDKNMERAIELERSGNWAMAMEHLGAAIHTLQDATSPSHRGFQVFDPSWSTTSPQVRKHVMAETSDPGTSFNSGPSLTAVTYAAWVYFANQVGIEVPGNPLGLTVQDPSSHALIEVPE